jgi:conjugative transfer region protein TrbK
MDGKTLARLAALIFVVIAVTAAALDLAREEESALAAQVRLPVITEDPLREGQRHCQQLGETAARDAGCLRLWAETRDRFLGRATEPQIREGQ